MCFNEKLMSVYSVLLPSLQFVVLCFSMVFTRRLLLAYRTVRSLWPVFQMRCVEMIISFKLVHHGPFFMSKLISVHMYVHVLL